jgi:hypothetical protein
VDFALAGELAALLVLIRNINLLVYRFELKELNVVSDQQAADTIKISCNLDTEAFSRLRINLDTQKQTSVALKSCITNPNGDSVAQVRSVWVVKKR